MLDIDGGPDIDSGFQDVRDILIALGVGTVGRI